MSSTLDFLAQLPIGFALIGRSGETKWINAAARELLDAPDLAATLAFVDGTDQPYAFAALTPGVTRDLAVHAHGRVIALEVGASEMNGDLLLSFRDISADRESRERYRHIIDNANEIIYRTDHRGNFTYVNPASVRITGYDEHELIGRHYLALIDTDYRESAAHFYEHQFRSRERSTYFEFPLLTRSGMRIWVGQSVLTVLDGDRITGYEAIARDITHRRGVEEDLARARDAALQSARAKSEFLANVSHEIRTPLNGVLGMTGLLLATPLTPEQRDYAEAIRTSGETLISIVNDVLDLARVEAGKLTIEPVDFHLDDLVDSVIDQFAARAAAKRLKFRAFVGPEVTRTLRGDPHRIRQVLLNLVGNAVKFTDRGEVLITVMQPAHNDRAATLRFLVTDTGIGIPASVQQRLFTPFTQADGSTTRKYGGSGLGLAVSKQLVEAMSGEIGVISVENEGSTFWFELPLQKQSTSAALPAPAYDFSRVRALLVDADEIHRALVARHLAETRIVLDEAHSAADGVAAAYKTHYDLVLFDMQLPDDDGLGFARAIRGDRALDSTRLLLLTAFGRRRQDIGAFQAAGIDAFLLKPVRRAQLCSAVARLVAHEEEARVPVAEPEPLPATRARVLVVEDNSVNQLVALGQIQRLGHQCILAATGAEAIEAVREQPFDLILMDCQMPDMDGYEATRRIRQMDGAVSKTPIVAITAHALPGEREKCLAAGMNDYLAKPVSIEQIGAVIRLWGSKVSTPSQKSEADLMEADDHYVLDRERVSSFLAISRTQQGFLEGLVRTFRQDVPSRLDALRAAAAGSDPLDLAHAAHALKSSCGSVGAKRMYAVAAALEQSARAGRLDGAAASIEQLAAEFSRVIAAYSGIVRRSGKYLTAQG